MFPEHNATLQAHRAMLRRAEARAIDQARLHYTMSQLYHSAMLNAYWMAYTLAETRADEWRECRLALLQSHRDYLPLFRQRLLYANIDRQLEAWSLFL